jgi:membrane protease YdiL (CAAX protease family)
MPSFFTRQRVPIDRFRVLYPRLELRGLVAYALFYAFLSGCTGMLIRKWPLPLMGSPDFLCDYWYFLVYKIGFLLVAPMIVFSRLGYGWSDLAPLGLSARDFTLSLLALVIGILPNLDFLLGMPEWTYGIRLNHVSLRIVIGLTIPLFCAAIPEEFFFRGWLQTRLEQRYGRLVAILGTAILFTAWHIPSRYFLAFGGEGRAGDLASVLNHAVRFVFVWGLVFGLLWDRYRRLLPLILLHWAVDAPPWIAAMLAIR